MMHTKKGIPEEVQMMAEALVRTCAKHKVCLTGFLFGGDTEAHSAFVQHISTVTDTGEGLRNLHDMLLDFIERADVPRTILSKNDA
jgi:hypothetical protein